MKVCIVSDSHDRADVLAQAVAEGKAGAEAVIHCGDLIGAQTVLAALEHGLPVHLIHGNNLGDAQATHWQARQERRRGGRRREHRRAALPRRRGAHRARRAAHLRRPLRPLRLRDGLHRRMGPGVLRPLAPRRSAARRRRQGRHELAREPGTVAGPSRAVHLDPGRPGRDELRGPRAGPSDPREKRRPPTMFTTNPFANLPAAWPAGAMQAGPTSR